MTDIGPGHNDQLRSIVERIEAVEADIKERRQDVSDIYAESKSNGYDVKALKTIVRLRRQSPDDRAAQEAVLEAYKQALGMA